MAGSIADGVVTVRMSPAAVGRRWLAASRTIRRLTGAGVSFDDITADLETILAGTGLLCGTVNVQTRHTTTGIVVNEHEPLLLDDLETTLERVAPTKSAYRHDDLTRRTVNLVVDERVNGHAHCKSLVLRASETINVVDGRLALGRWQRVFLVDCDGGQWREVSVVLTGIGDPCGEP